MLRILNERNLEIVDIPFPPSYLVRLITLIDKGVINGSTAKNVFDLMFDTGKDPDNIVKEHGLEMLKDQSFLLEVMKR